MFLLQLQSGKLITLLNYRFFFPLFYLKCAVSHFTVYHVCLKVSGKRNNPTLPDLCLVSPVHQGWPTVDTCPLCGLTCQLWSTTTSSPRTDPARRPEASAERFGASTRKTARWVQQLTGGRRGGQGVKYGGVIESEPVLIFFPVESSVLLSHLCFIAIDPPINPGRLMLCKSNQQ